MNVSVSVHSARHAWRATARSDLASAIRRAQRHSRLVRLLRYGIPAGLVASAAAYGLMVWLNPFGSLAGLPTITGMAVSGTRITMEAPRLAGYTRDGRAYELVATAAAQDLKKPHFIELQEIHGKMVLRDGNTVSVRADAGSYDSSTEALSLHRNITVSMSNGGRARLTEAEMDIKKGTLVSRKPVELVSPNGRVDAQQMEIRESGAVLRFGGGVKVSLIADAEPQTARTERAP